MPLFSFSTHAYSNLETSTESTSDQDHITVKHLLSQHKWEESINILDSLLKKEPKSISVLSQMATALLYKGQRKEALERLTIPLSQMSGPPKVLLMRRFHVISRIFVTNKSFQIYQDGLNLLFSNRYAEAQEKFERALSEEPDNIEALLRLGQTEILKGENEEATKNLILAKELNPFEAEIKLWLGRSYFLMGKMGEALSHLQAAYAVSSGSELAPLWLSDVLFSLGQNNFAVRILESDLKGWPSHIFSQMSLTRFRTQAPISDLQVLELAKKDLQNLMSRINEYPTAQLIRPEGELSLTLPKFSKEMRAQIESLIKQVSSRIKDKKT